MADNTPQKSDAPFATRVDPLKDDLSEQQRFFIKQVEQEQWKKRTQRMVGRNAVVGLAIGALVMGIYGYTWYSVSQENAVNELDEDARRPRTQEPKTGAN
ncbi:hypothetical protein JOB18_011356 [Solea senegalensis]|uniref:Cytochrome c oxidase assembly factor 3 n=2 Tax=Solea senegalensis TaxID=28829 RepID=A0AAV6RMM8_SOLSE|nr:cytochrome c oxidase assembly factor 3 homolog, mitochondrial [Solea senegalensis]KAG7506633.1 hypothetical protein JOB18_011356 [Solea senegalensis]